MYRYRHIRLKLDSSALSRPSIKHHTTHRVLSFQCARWHAARGVRKWRAHEVPRGQSALVRCSARAAELNRVFEQHRRPRSHRQLSHAHGIPWDGFHLPGWGAKLMARIWGSNEPGWTGGGTTWWRPGVLASGTSRALRHTECECWRPRTCKGPAAMLVLVGWGDMRTHRKSALDGLLVHVS